MQAQTLDIDHAEAPNLIRALAEKPCPECVPVWQDFEDTQVCQHGTACDVHCCICHSGFEFSTTVHEKNCGRCSACKGTGLANPWASEECSGGLGCLDCVSKPEPLVHDALIYARGRICNGSGRVTKAVGLEELFEHGLTSIQAWKGGWAATVSISWAAAETPLLAALRAVAKAQGL